MKEAYVSWTGVAGIGIGAPGRIDTTAGHRLQRGHSFQLRTRGLVVGAANIFGGAENVPLAQALQDSAHGVPTTLVNDADAAVAADSIQISMHPNSQVELLIPWTSRCPLVVNDYSRNTIPGAHAFSDLNPQERDHSSVPTKHQQGKTLLLTAR
eukprot:5608172-Amphidinium_carterae.1